jgi:arylsulfatase A-like enzyme
MTPPNVLIIMTDHQRADTALAEGPAVMPNLHRFARQGVTFTNAFCPSPHCCPSRATFFTGLYPSGHGVWNNICNDMALSRGLKPGVRTWSEDLARAGYRLEFAGKWHVSVEEGPAGRGFHERFVSAGRGTLHGARWEHYRRLAEQPEPGARGEGQILRPGYGAYTLYGQGEVEALGHDRRVLEEALAALGELRESAQPWCLFAGFIGPHDPYVVPAETLERYDLGRIELPPSYGDAMEDKPALYQRMRRQIFGQLSQREVREGMRHYYAYCTWLDDLFGQILERLEASGQAENTLVLYCSDHGDYCGDHGLFAKGIPCFQGAYRVPAVARWPAGIAGPGRRVEAFVSLADFAPTLIELAGQPLGRRFSGASLLPFLRGEAPPAWRDVIHTQCNGVELYYCQRSVMTREAKYTFNGFDRDELYDLRHDPHELVNLADNPAYAALQRELVGQMWRFACQEGDTLINPYITVGLAPWGPAEAFRMNTTKT